MIEFPNRTPQHIIDEKGLSVLRLILPESFIFRELSGRDYGIDALVEFTEKNNVIGKLASIQIKSKRSVQWNKNNTFKMKISKSTMNYWLNNNNPVYLILVDINQHDAYFINVKKQIREHYDEYINNEFSFIFDKTMNINSDDKRIIFELECFIELGYMDYINRINEFSINAERYYEHILSNIGRDFFLPVDDDVIDETMYIIQVLNNIKSYLLWENIKIDFDTIRKESSKIYRNYYECNEYNDIIEYESNKIHISLKEEFEFIYKLFKKIVLDTEKYFWKNIYRSTYDKAKSLNLESDPLYSKSF